MNPEKINIAIAEACGWTEIKACGFSNGVPSNWNGKPPHYEQTEVIEIIPNYYGDLNAMHEAWLFLRRGEGKDELRAEGDRTTYGEHLSTIASRVTMEHGGSYCYTLANLTAAQRAEAFLKTIGKWEEDDQTDKQVTPAKK
jgi:hypothetical protein